MTANASKNESIFYKDIGLKLGLEIHQQLEGKKLFCSCATEIRKGSPDYKIRRALRASAGEDGKIDAAVAYQMNKRKEYDYEGYEDINCLVESDSEPPHDMNTQAQKIALKVAKALHCNIVDQIQVMRKIVVDGSNPSGFQRTALVGTRGYIEVNGKKIGIPTVCLEEEACQIVERNHDHDIYNLSRQGIPLIEIATDPDITTPEECKETAEHIGLILRSVPGMKRGIGTIRQDVNISIIGGDRTELKGFQDLRSIPKVIENEIFRQQKIISSGKKVETEVRKVESDFSTSYLRPMPGSARMYPETDCEPIIPDLSSIEDVELISDRVERLGKNTGVDKNLLKIMIKQGIEIENIISNYPNIKPVFFADYFVSYAKELKKRFNVEVSNEDMIKFSSEVFDKMNSGTIPKEAAIEILAELGRGKKPDYSKYAMISDDVLESGIKEIVAKNKGAPFGTLMGIVMTKFRGKADGKKISEMLKKMS